VPLILNKCASDFARPLSLLFNRSLSSNSNVFGDREIRLNNKIGKKPF
jgi:hypothetical protein